MLHLIIEHRELVGTDTHRIKKKLRHLGIAPCIGRPELNENTIENKCHDRQHFNHLLYSTLP
jgi:hypothetical protein